MERYVGVSRGNHKCRERYNETDGVFTAPIAGEYVLFVNVHIMLNGLDQVIAIAFGNNFNYM